MNSKKAQLFYNSLAILVGVCLIGTNIAIELSNWGLMILFGILVIGCLLGLKLVFHRHLK